MVAGPWEDTSCPQINLRLCRRAGSRRKGDRGVGGGISAKPPGQGLALKWGSVNGSHGYTLLSLALGGLGPVAALWLTKVSTTAQPMD